jgi:DNA-binding transcriptional LysR family regulator
VALRDLQIDWLHCLVAVVDAGSLSAATVQLHRSQSAVSMQLKKLEDAVGHRLLERGARRLELTEQGRTLLGYARRMPAGRGPGALQPAVLSGRVRLGVPDDYAATYLTPVLRRFAPRHSGVEIGEQSTALIPRVERGAGSGAHLARPRAARALAVP